LSVSTSVLPRIDNVPGNDSPPPLSARDRAPNRIGGATTSGTCSAALSAIPTGIRQSVASGRCGPCCSVEPIEITTGSPLAAASRTSSHVKVSISIWPRFLRRERY
jgi:hypothetical protein